MKEVRKSLSISTKNIPKKIPIYGNMDYRNPYCPDEALEQASFFNQIRLNYPKSWGLIATSIQNESGKESGFRTHLAKKAGLIAGAPDVIIPGKRTFLCELKRRDRTKSRVGQKQIDYLLAAQAAGCFVCIALGADAAWEAFNKWKDEKNADT